MLTLEERALSNHLSDKLIELCVSRDEAVREGNLERLYELQAEIDETATERRELLDGPEAT